MLDKILETIGALPKRNQPLKSTGNELGGAVLIAVALLVIIVVATVLISKR